MAQLKDTTVSGSLRATDTLYSTKIQASIFNIPTASNGTTYGPGTANYFIASNGTSVYWTNTAPRATGDKNGADITTTYLKLAGGTMTGVLTTKSNMYTDAYNSGALNLGNSNIDGVNSIYTADVSDNAAEGIHFYRDSTHVDSLHAKSGVLYFTPNRALGNAGTNYSVYHSGITTFNGNASTATEFNSDATVTLTGDTTGTSAGSKKSWSIATTTKKLSQTTATALSSFTDTTALIYTAAGGSNTITDKPTSVDAFGCLSLKTADGWYGQLLISSNTATGLYWRTATSLSGGWKKLLDSTNYTDYTVKKDGTGASGSWGISITGNAATATKATQDGSGNTITSTYIKKAGDSTTGGLAINASNSYSSYNEGLRINAGARTYATLLLGGTNNSTAGTNDGAFWLGVYNTSSYTRRLMIAHNGSTATNTYFYASSASQVSPALHLGTSGTITSGNADAVTGGTVYTTLSEGYVTLATEQTVSGRKTFSNLAAATFKPSSGDGSCNINYNTSLNALVFSFV